MRYAAIILVLLVVLPASADVVHMKNGKAHKGEIVAETSDLLVLKTRDTQLTLKKADIHKIERLPLPGKEKPAAPKPPKKTPKPRVFTMDDYLKFERVHDTYCSACDDEETKLRMVIAWKRDYKGKPVLLSGKVTGIVQEVTTVLTDEGEKPLTTCTVKVNYLTFSSEFKTPKVKSPDIKTGGSVYLKATFRDGDSPPHSYQPVFASISLATPEDIRSFLPPQARDEAADQDSPREPDESGCNFCKGAGTIGCRRCGGDGQVECSRCKGSKQKTCAKCRGRGRVPVHSMGRSGGTSYRRCPKCSGRGHYICPNCKGKATIKCTSCKGTGVKTCPKCRGTGKKKR